MITRRRRDCSGADSRTAPEFTKARLDGAVLRDADFSADMCNQSMGPTRGVLTSARGRGFGFTGVDLTGVGTGEDLTSADRASTGLKNVTGGDRTNLYAVGILDRARH
ncbi:MAG: hypothetical protein AAF281_05215 [Pseudomonadota bacterium]